MADAALPIRLMRERKYKREFGAAAATYLGEATYLQLEPVDRDRVDAEVARMLKASFTPATAMQFFTEYWEVKAQTRARAMARLGVKPAGNGLAWRRFIPWLLVMPEPNFFYQFNPYSIASSDAERFLSEHGVVLPPAHGAQ